MDTGTGPETAALRIVQLNVGSLLEQRWEERRVEVAAWLDELEPDVVCFQEVWQDQANPNTAEWIADHAAGEWHWTFGGFPLPTHLHPDESLLFGSAVLSRFPIDRTELHQLPVNHDAPDDPLATVVFDLLHVRTAGLDVFSTHLQPPPHQAYHRVRQVLHLDEVVRGAVDPRGPMPPIVCGDFNAEPGSDEIRFLTSNAVIDGRSTYFQDAWAVTHFAEPGYTQDPANPQYASMNLPPKRIDYVFVGNPYRRPGGAGRVLGCELAFHEPRTGTLASDHYGLVVDVAWPTRP